MNDNVFQPVTPALGWITDLLAEAEIPFQVAGGVAAAAYGVTREVNNIDLYIAAEHVPQVMRLVGVERIVHQPWRHRDESWDLILLAVEYKGQRIEVRVADVVRFRERATGKWLDAAIDLDGSVPVVIWGVEVPVMPRAQLVEYKHRLDRDIDRQDLSELEKVD